MKFLPPFYLSISIKNSYNFCVLIYCLLPFSSYAQSKEDMARIDKGLRSQSISLYDKGKYDEAIVLQQKLIKESRKIGYKEGIINGYSNLSYIMNATGKYREALAFVELQEKENERSYDKGAQANIYAAKGAAYSYLELYQQAISYFKKSLALSENISDKVTRQDTRAFCYSNLMMMYESIKRMDTAFYYSKQAFNEQDDIDNTSKLAYYYIYSKKDFDSAAYYIKYAGNKVKKEKSKAPAFQLYSFYTTLGSFYIEKKEYDSARICYNKLLQISFERKIPTAVRDSYHLLSNLAELEKNEKMAAIYLKKYTVLSDSIAKSQKIQINYPIQQYIKESQKEYKRKEYKFRYIIIGVALLAVSVLLFFIIHNRRKAGKLKNILKNREEVILEKELETQELKNKVKDGFEEVVVLARKNKPEFVTRFIEIYPEFYQALLKVYPDIPPETLKFCALLKLNFSTKEIADYNFITPRAIQLRKNRLRKKLDIPSAEDIYVWINNLGQNTDL